MKKLILSLALTAAVIGCNKTTTSSTGTHARTGEPVTKSLSVMAAQSQTIARGATDKVTVTINRDNFDDPVTIVFSGLPAGVTAAEKELVVPAGSKMATATLVAAKDAAVGDHTVTIVAKATGIPENQQPFKLTVK